MTKTQVTVFSLVLAAGVGSSVFFFKHLKKESDTVSPDDNGDPQTSEVDKAPDPSADKSAPQPPAVATPAQPAAPKVDDVFREPEKLIGAVADLVKARDAKAIVEMASEEAIPAEVRSALTALLDNPDYELADAGEMIPLARINDLTRWVIPLKPLKEGLPERQIYIDIREVEGGKSWEIVKVLVPTPGSEAGPGLTGILPITADPVTVAHYFSRAIMSSDFKTARALSDPDKITDERIAALMIAVEEGGYSLHTDRPLTQTLARDTVSWIIARIRNDSAVSEFALEMSKLDADKAWLIDNISFDKVIQMTAAEAGAGNVAYAPIVKNPQGGDSLVVFFEFDSAILNPRAQKQVNSIATILKGNPARQININGHADALGLDEYNASLSAKRAKAVKEALIGLGVATNQIVTKGFGETAPLSPNFKPDGSDNPSGRSQNRRTEVYLNF